MTFAEHVTAKVGTLNVVVVGSMPSHFYALALKAEQQPDGTWCQPFDDDDVIFTDAMIFTAEHHHHHVLITKWWLRSSDPVKRPRGRPRVRPLPDPTAPRRSVGRPTVTGRTMQVVVRLSPAEVATISAKANADLCTIAEYFRRLALGEKDKP